MSSVVQMALVLPACVEPLFPAELFAGELIDCLLLLFRRRRLLASLLSYNCLCLDDGLVVIVVVVAVAVVVCLSSGVAADVDCLF